MKLAVAGLGLLVGIAAGLVGRAQTPPARKGVALSELAWPDAEAWLTPSMVVVLPLGAGALEQGPHMKLDSDERLARYLASRVTLQSAVVVAAPLNYHFYPAYTAYPGSTTLSDTVARDVTVDAVRSLARYGPRRFYVLNTSASTVSPLAAAARTVADAGILLAYTDPDSWIRKQAGVLTQAPIAVGHAEEAATSMMLFVDPSAVDMTRAKREYAQGRGSLIRDEGGEGVLSRSGTLGDATLATAAKGKVLVDALVAGIVAEIDDVRASALPEVRTAAPAPPPPPPPPRPIERPAPKLPSGCTPADDRTIRNIGAHFTYLWSQTDADGIAGLFTGSGDIRHPDGSIERGQEIIRANRARLFTRREYRGSKHPLQLNDVRCLGNDVALADGKWELRLQEQPQTTPGRGLVVALSNQGWCTLVLQRREGGWGIEAWRYTVNPPEGAPAPVLLPKPGFTGRGGG